MVLEQGRIIERGTHDELIAKKGKYYQLYTGNVRRRNSIKGAIPPKEKRHGENISVAFLCNKNAADKSQPQ